MLDDLERIPVLSELAEKSKGDIIADMEAVREGRKPWDVYGSTPIEHNASFSGLVKPDFNRWVEKRIHNGSIRNMFEVMGSGELLRRWGLRGVFTELIDSRDGSGQLIDADNDIRGIYYHILDRRVIWQAREYLEEKGVEGFDLIVCRPAGGVEALGETFKTHHLLMTRLAGLLAINGSLFYQFGMANLDGINERRKRVWLDIVKDTVVQERFNIKVAVEFASLQLTKLKDPILRLPPIPAT